MSLRWKITATITVVCALVALALSLTVHVAYASRQADEARRLQAERIELVRGEYLATGQATLGGRLDDPALPARLRAAARRGELATMLQRTGTGAFIWAAVPVRGQVLSLRSGYQDRLDALASLDRVLLIGSLVIVAAGTGAGVLIGARLSLRLRRAAATARQVADGDRTARVRSAIGDRPRDEAADLAHAVDAMADALQARLDAERRVTADIAHELRTPLTGLSTAAELLPPSRPAELVAGRVRVLRALVEDVLEVARLDTATERADLSDIALGEFTTRRTAAFAPGAEVRIHADAVVSTDPRRLERILANLLTNAAKHGASPIIVEVDRDRIQVRDHGPGFPPELLRDGPSRFRKAADGPAGHGLGLTIATGQSRVLGACLTFTNPPHGGALATLTGLTSPAGTSRAAPQDTDDPGH